MVNIIICDDERRIGAQLELLLKSYAMSKGVSFNIEVYSDSSRLLRELDEGLNSDIIFLDIELGNATGVDVGKYIRDHLHNNYVTIIFFSSHTQYHEELFKVTPTGFLKKPVQEQELTQLLDIALARLSSVKNYGASFFAYKKETEMIAVNFTTILYFESVKRQMKIVTQESETKIDYYYGTVRDTYEKLDKELFHQVHRAFLVNLEKIKKVSKTNITLVNDTQIPIGKKYYDDFINALSTYHLK